MGPLNGFRVIELTGLGPAPFAGMMLADMGAEVIVVDRASSKSGKAKADCSRRGKQSIALNLKSEAGIATLLKLVENSDALIEGFRPGVAERLGIGPEDCLAVNPKLVYGRMTGWGQTGPLAQAAGHDINYISLTGALAAVGTAEGPPIPPLNLVGDFGGGGMFLVTGVLAALLEAQKSGKGQVIDAAMTDGSAVLMAFIHSMSALGMWQPQKGMNFLDGAAHFYGAYETKDGKYISIGSIEPQFYALLMQKAELDPKEFGMQMNMPKWPDMKESLAQIFSQKTQAEWCKIMEGTDVCFAPVLSYAEAPSHPHNQARGTYVELDGIDQPAPAPRFSRTASEIRHGVHPMGADTEIVLSDFGFSETEIAQLRDADALS